MAQYIDKDALVAEIEKRWRNLANKNTKSIGKYDIEIFTLLSIKSFINSLEVKEVDLIIHTIIAECCDWLAMRTNLSHDEIEGCRNLMLVVKDEKLKAQKGE